ncbi:peptidoglycan-binding protein [Streptomyces sp. AK02-01A]|uniref:peptidoglycan-binding domain-containing protein n=1 Tax=Streptomyces sp. AK02-01A TaxID=3028648 RepID=UPI0029AE8230|nr:peptidoglycan-binding protein [Streptomyces sp. AK02-01A]MDX3853900.1 peptidoglycan-binding protein [Streptomyces sp. AK02-01A]
MSSRLRTTVVSASVGLGAVILALVPSGAGAASDTDGRATAARSAATWCGYYSGTALTRRGDTGSHVREVQCLLNKQAGRKIVEVDGIFGPRTEGWVESYQRYRGLDDEGLVGVRTWAALRR